MRALIKLLLVIVFLPLMMLATTIPWLVRWEAGRRMLARATFRGVNRILGLHVTLQGELTTQRPLLLVSNHSSYVDILALGSRIPVAFTPKKEIARWPVIGFCCKLAGCVFVDRTPKAISATKALIAQKLEQGRIMCIFAEGTTNDGTQLKPFKSSFFGLAEEASARVQPAAIRYTHINGQALDAQGRALIAWYDDMSLLPHLWRLLGYRRIDATIQLLPPLESTADRKALCARSQAVIKQALEHTL